jgi:hypothetical protein
MGGLSFAACQRASACLLASLAMFAGYEGKQRSKPMRDPAYHAEFSKERDNIPD